MVAVDPGSLKKFKAKVVLLTGRHRGIRFAQMLGELNGYLRGWSGYYLRLLPNTWVFRELDPWIRRRLRMYRWVQWKTRKKRLQALRKAGVSEDLALRTCGCPGIWRASRTPALCACLSNERIARAGLVTLEEHYERMKS